MKTITINNNGRTVTKPIIGQITIDECINNSNEVGFVTSIQLPDCIEDMEIGLSDNGKLLPSFEYPIMLEVTLEDGTITSIEGNITLWWNRQHAKAVVEAKQKQQDEIKKAEAKRIIESTFSPEQLKALELLGVKK